MGSEADSFRRLIRRIVSRFRKPVRAAVYRPVLSEQAFIAFLRDKGLARALADSGGEAHEASGSVHDAAEHFRELIGARFFVRPDEVSALCERAYRSHPEWRQRLVASVSAATQAGLGIYGSCGPALDGKFPWASLPPGPGGDSLFPYRPHRFAFLPRMALAVFLQEMRAEQLVEILDGWIAEAENGQNPFCYGTNLVVIQRILATTWAWVFLAARPVSRTRDGLGLEGRLLRILWADVSFLEPQLGLSVANNHLLADWFAAYFLQAVVPEFVEKDDPEAEGRFSDEFLRQTYQDGGSFEHSAHYHEFACEMGAAYLLLCERQDRAQDIQLRQRIEALLRFQAGLTGAEAIPLPFGNAVEDTLFPLDSGEGWCSGSLRELYRSIFGAELSPVPESDVTLERAFWLLSGGLAPPSEGAAHDPAHLSFPDGGIHVFPDDEPGTRLIFRTGPREGLPLAAGHMHADLLSVYLSQSGMPMIVDAGTYTYRCQSKHWAPGSPAWRSYLAGPSAHNTFTIEGHDPLGAIGGDFRSLDVAARVRSREDSGPGLAWVEGMVVEAGAYGGYTRGVIHVKGRYWVVYDRPDLADHGGRPCWYGFQCAPGVRVTPGEVLTHLDIEAKRIGATIITSLAGAPALLEGSTAPLGGWVSERYGEITPAPQLRYALGPEAAPSAFVFTGLETRAPEAVRLESLASGGLAVCISSATCRDILIFGAEDGSGTVSNEFEGLTFDGRLLWLRLEGGSVTGVRWLGGRRLDWPKHDLHYVFGTASGELLP